ncbi:MAG: carboxypeptidase regulatory-like domain-containing protein [Myxococcales bacterium]|nr:carboxypeptidase regulatory-like domain-containing protein [Myxococcales bacterium]
MKMLSCARPLLLAVLAAVLAAVTACSSKPPPASAFRIESRDQLVGGRRALGEVGDFKLSNGVVQAVVQDVGHSRGFGAFGGSLIDVDLVRGGKRSSAVGPVGNDYFTEMFPAFFLEAIEPEKVEIADDGRGGAARIRVFGKGGDFLSLTKSVNDIVLPAPFDYQVDYILEPGKQYLKIVTTIANPDKTKAAGFPLAIPFGFITLMGEGQRLFVPGKAGFDMRFRLDEVYRQPSALTAFPGEVAPWVATEGDGVSYGVAASPKGAGYLNNPTYYPTAKSDWLLVPMASGSFLATFWGKPPAELAPGKSYSFTGFLAVGTGDVASVQKVIYAIDEERTPTKTGTVSGRVREAGTGVALEHVNVVLQDEQGSYVSSARTLKDGVYSAPVPPGKYRAHAVDSVRTPASSEDLVEVAADGLARIDLWLARPAYLSVSVRDEKGRALPAKVSVEATYEQVGTAPPRTFLYNLKIGERLRTSDLDPDTSDASTRRYLERVFFAPSGTAGRAIRPGKYTVYASRGIEYDLGIAEVELRAGENRELPLVLRQVMETPGWASADFHVHSAHSVDSDMALPERVASYAVEGVDYLSSTDHNFVSDFKPTVEALKLQQWLRTTVGLELTTLEMGHFNAFPVVLEPGPVTHGSFAWFRRPPSELFSQLALPKSAECQSCIGSPGGKTLIQVNHPRDSIMGYFSAFSLGAYSGNTIPNTSAFKLDQTPLPDGTPSPYAPENFTLDFDLLEVFNGKHLEQVHHYRIPAVPPEGADPTVPACSATLTADCIPAAGVILEQKVAAPDPQKPGSTIDLLQPVYPGALEDWYTLAARRRITAVGNSDSHGASAEAGLPRTYIYVGKSADGSMLALDEDAMLDGLKEQRVLVTNGPFVELTVDGQPVGGEVVAPDGKVSVQVQVRAAPWVDVSRVLIRRGGKDVAKVPQTLADIAVPPSTDLVRLERTLSFEGIPDDSFIVAEVSGERSMWPVYTPYEVESILINEAVGAVGAAFGFGNKYGKYRPVRVRQVTPFAFTNPIRVTRSVKQGLFTPKRVPLPIAERAFSPGRLPDLRRLFGSLHSDVE